MSDFEALRALGDEIRLRPGIQICEVLVTDNSGGSQGFWHITLSVVGDDFEAVTRSGQELWRLALKAHEVELLRYGPETDSEKEFDTKTTRHIYFARFTVRQKEEESVPELQGFSRA